MQLVFCLNHNNLSTKSTKRQKCASVKSCQEFLIHNFNHKDLYFLVNSNNFLYLFMTKVRDVDLTFCDWGDCGEVAGSCGKFFHLQYLWRI